MTNDLRIEQTIYCDRTGHTYRVTLPLEEAETLARRLQHQQINTEKIQAFIQTLQQPLPDLVVLYQNKLVILNTVSTKGERGIMRALFDLTRSTLFQKIPPRARKNSKRGKRDSSSPTALAGEGSPMEKFGVDESPRPNEKLGQSVVTCPLCGSPCQKHGAVILCPNHGSKPFETALHADDKK